MAYFRSFVRSGVLTEPDKLLLVEYGVSEHWLTIPGAPLRRRNRGPNGRVSRPLSEEDAKPLLDEGRSDTIWILIRQGVITKEEWSALRTYGALAIDPKGGIIQAPPDMSGAGARESRQSDNEREAHRS